MYKILLIIIGLSLSVMAQKDDVSKIDQIIKNIRVEKKLDKRTSVFNLTPEKKGNLVSVKGECDSKKLLDLIAEKAKSANIEISLNDVNLLPEASLGKDIYGLVSISVINIRTKPEHAAEMATQTILGTVVKILKSIDKEWFYIQTPDGYIGYAEANSIVQVNAKEMKSWVNAQKIIITSTYTTCLQNPTEDAMPVSDLVAGNLLKVTEKTSKYYSVEYPDGRKGFVALPDAEIFTTFIENLSFSKSGVINTAKRFLGIPYLWGGTSTKGLDCSGFTKTVYLMNGVILERDASQQVNTGVEIEDFEDYKNLEQGDLLFFGPKPKKGEKQRITHVAMYIGNGEYIHSAGWVKINSLDPKAHNFSKYRKSMFVAARRILTSLDKNGVELIKSNKYYFGDK